MSDWTEIVVTALAAGGAVGSIVLVAVKVWLEKSISAKFGPDSSLSENTDAGAFKAKGEALR